MYCVHGDNAENETKKKKKQDLRKSVSKNIYNNSLHSHTISIHT